jgi:ribonuclease P protein component
MSSQELILIIDRSQELKTIKSWTKSGQTWPKPKMVISKKIVKNATDRNRIKRIIRQALGNLNLKDGQITVIIKKNIANYKVADVKQKLESYLKK